MATRPIAMADSDDELRRVTVLFADIQGSTALIQNLDPEATAAVLDTPVHVMVTAVERFDGIVCKLGDGILAVFGAPSVCEDHAVRACLAALAIRDGLRDAASDVPVRMGIHTGDVVMRSRRIGRAQVWDPIGPALHIAARLEQTAEPGLICISDTTHDQAQGFVQIAPLPPVSAKGLPEKLTRHSLLGSYRDADRWAVRSAGGLVDMVDRVEELGTLLTVLRSERAAGPVVVQLFGAPGIGKSRLLHEMLRSPESARCHVVRLSGDRHGQETAFHPFAVWLRSWLDIRSSDRAEAARAKLHRMASAAAIDDAMLLRLLGLRDAPTAAFGDLVPIDASAAVLGLLTFLAGGKRIVLACEDVDCFDLASRELLLSVLANAEHLDLVLISTSRSRTRLSRSAPTRSLTLNALSDDDTMALFHRVDDSLASQPRLAAIILAKTGGNPLFVEEVSALISRGGATVVTRADQADPMIPDRIEALIADRLARMPRAQKQLVQICSVLGTTVPLRLLSQIMRVDEPELHKRLLRLQAEQVLHETRRYPDPEFAFKHALTRDAAYQMMLSARRRDLHARAVEALESDSMEPFTSRLDDLCRHSVRAGMPAEAVEYLFKAAALDAEKSAFQIARARLTQAVELSRTLPDTDEVIRRRIDLLLALRRMLNVAGQYSELAELLNEAEQLAARIGDNASMTQVMAQRVHVLNIMGLLPQAIALGERAVKSARQLGDPSLYVLAAHHLAQAHFNIGNLHAADAALRDAQSSIEHAELPARSGTVGTLSVLVHCTRAMALAMLGDDAAAAATATAAIRLAERSGRLYDMAFALFVQGLSRLESSPRNAAISFSEGLALCDEGQIEQLAPPLLSGLGHALLACDDLSRATSHLERAYSAAQTSNRPMMLCWAASGLALARHSAGSVEAGRVLADEAVDVAQANGFRGYLVIALRLRAGVHEGARRLESLEAALALATELEMVREAERCRTALSQLRPS